MGALNVLVAVIAARFILLVAVVGAIWLTVIVTQSPDPYRLGLLAVYCGTVVLPMVWLASRR